MFTLECHLDRSGRFLERASSRPSLPGSPGRRKVPRLEYRLRTSSCTPDWASHSVELLHPGEPGPRGLDPATQQGWQALLALSLPWPKGPAEGWPAWPQ